MYDVAVVGGGPAGGSAAIFLSKAGIKTLVLDNDKGQTRRAWLENHYGVEGVGGPDLVDAGQRQAKKLGAEWVTAQVTGIAREEGGFTLTTEEQQSYQAKQVVLATGAAMALAEAINLEFTEGREKPWFPRVLKVDADGRTSQPGVWAAGIIAGASAHTIITAGHGGQVAVGFISEMQGKRIMQHDVMK